MIEALAAVAEKAGEVIAEKGAELASKAGEAIEAKSAEKTASNAFDPRKPLEPLKVLLMYYQQANLDFLINQILR